VFLVVWLSLCYSLSVHGFNQIFILCVNRFALYFHRRGDLPILGMELLVKNSELSNIFHPGQVKRKIRKAVDQRRITLLSSS
jgi:hypothetical protein